MTRFAPLASLRESWLTARAASFPWLEERLAWWRRREESFVRHAPFDLEEPGPRVAREVHGLCETWLPVERVTRDAHAILRAWFDLSAVDPAWEDDLLSRARSWIEARTRLASLPALPSQFLARLAARDAAEAFVFESHDPSSMGCSFDRYPEVASAVAALRPRRLWDAGCGTGEGTFTLAPLAGEVVGTTPSPWELMMARGRGRPHDRARTLAFRERTRGIENVRFEAGDMRVTAPGTFDVVVVAGVLGGVIFEEAEVARALGTVARALAPDGRAFVVDRFREDRHERARSLVEKLAPATGLSLRGVELTRGVV